jgi:hypothetical protein
MAAEPAPVASGSLFKIAQSDGKRTEIHALIKLTPEAPKTTHPETPGDF